RNLAVAPAVLRLPGVRGLGLRRGLLVPARGLARCGRTAVAVPAAAQDAAPGHADRRGAAGYRPAAARLASLAGRLTLEWMPFLLFAAVIAVLLAGFPVAFSLAGTALLFALGGVAFGGFEAAFLTGLPSRVFGIMTNETLIAVPLFVFMGVTLERARIAEDLLETL